MHDIACKTATKQKIDLINTESINFENKLNNNYVS